MSPRTISTAVALTVFLCSFAPSAFSDDAALNLTLRTRDKAREKITERLDAWDPRHTALIVIDVWDKHWCDGANKRVAAMAPRFSAFVDTLRSRGVFVIHAPSDTMKTYEGTPGRKLAQSAPAAPVPENTTFKWN